MRELEEKVKSAIKPGTPCGKVFYGAVFFVTGLLLVHHGFWKTLLVLALTLLGVIIGSAETLGKAIGKVVDKAVPPRNQKVVYTPEDMEKVKQATKARKEAAEKPADEAAGADKAEEKA